MHEPNTAPAIANAPVGQAHGTATEPISVWSANVVDRAFRNIPTVRAALVLHVSEARVKHWRTAGMAFLGHMTALARRYPDAVRVVRDALTELLEGAPHSAKDPVERLTSLAIELGHFAQEAQMARADGRWDEGEIAKARLEIRHLIARGYDVERDLDVLMAGLRKRGSW